MRNSEPSEPHENPTPQLVPPPTHAVAGTIGEKHVLVMVGLPARGKTHMVRFGVKEEPNPRETELSPPQAKRVRPVARAARRACSHRAAALSLRPRCSR